MGRWSYSNRIEADYLIKVRVFELKKSNLLKFHSWKYGTFSWKNNFTGNESTIGYTVSTYLNNEFIIFEYAVDETIDICRRFNLTTTPCNFGGKRYWFICSFMKNGVKCGKRVGVLYLKDGEFACRHCHNLTYESRKLSGRYKGAGNIIAFPDVDKAREAVKREYYNGKITKKYARYLKIAAKAKYAYAMHLGIATERWTKETPEWWKEMKQMGAIKKVRKSEVK